jgi:G8 domain
VLGAAGIAGGVRYLGLPWDEASVAQGAATTTTVAQPVVAASSSTVAQPSRVPDGWSRWSDKRSWTRGVPGPGETAVVTRPIFLDVDAKVAGVAVMPGGQLMFDPGASRRLESRGNMVVRGRLVMRPSSATVSHRLVFTGARERSFKGGGMDVVARDTGLWVMEAGRLEIAGAPKLAWTRAAGGLKAGATKIALQADPAGWRPGDELAITPTTSPADGNIGAYDIVTVESVNGRTVTLSAPLDNHHPSVKVAAGKRLTAEVLNLTRNVHIEGTAKGRAHIFVRSSRPQSLKQAAIRHMGPRKPDDGFSEFVLGRYPLHIHMCYDGSRGSLVEGVVIRDAGSHAFVPHLSNGITFRDCISHDTYEDAYWWDGAPDTRTQGDPSHDILYDRCVASLVKHDPPYRGYRLTGFFIGRGDRNVAKDCVAVGVQGATDASGFEWPEGSEGVWKFTGCVAHNNEEHGIFTWQNTGLVHVISDFVGYHNTQAGISHGAYQNPYVYKDSVLYGNGYAAVAVHATAAGRPLSFQNLICDGAGLSDYLVVAERHEPRLAVGAPTTFSGCRFRGARKAAFGFVYDGGDGPSNRELFSVSNCRFDGNEFWLAKGIQPGSQIAVSDPSLGSLLLRRTDQPGRLVREWNAKVSPR